MEGGKGKGREEEGRRRGRNGKTGVGYLCRRVCRFLTSFVVGDGSLGVNNRTS